MGKHTNFSLGDLTTTGAGARVDISQADTVGVTWFGTYVGALLLEVSMDGTNWAPAPGFTQTNNTPGKYTLTLPAKFLRARMTAYTSGTCQVKGGYDDVPKTKTTFGTLGDLDSVAAGAAVDISQYEKVLVTVTPEVGAYDASNVDIEYGFGTFWFKPGLGTFKTSSFTLAGSLEVPPGVQKLRANMTVSNGIAFAVRFGALDA